jgi:hypothetical protein
MSWSPDVVVLVELNPLRRRAVVVLNELGEDWDSTWERDAVLNPITRVWSGLSSSW